MKGTTFKRCSCHDPHSGRPLPRTCPQPARPPPQTAAHTLPARTAAALPPPPPPAPTAATKPGALIKTAVKTDAPIPTPDQIRRALHLDITPTELPTMGVYLTDWLAGRKN